MLTAGELAGMQATAAAALPDTVTIVRPVDDGALDPDTGVWTPATPATVYSGPGRVRPPAAEEIQVIFGDRQVTTTAYVVTIPASAPEVLLGDVVTVTASSDPHIGARSFRVTRTPAGSWLVIRKLGAETVE